MRRPLLLATAGVATTFAIGAAFSVLGTPAPAPSASAYASASASVSAAPTADESLFYVSPPGPPVAPKAVTWVPPADKSDKPDEAAWAHAEPLELPRKHYRCSASRIREWVRVVCKLPDMESPFVGVRVVGGSHVDVSVSNPGGGERGGKPLGVVFPVRKGDRRMLEFARVIPPGWKQWTLFEELDIVVSEAWLDGDAAPTITVD